MKLKDIINTFKQNANFLIILKSLGAIALITLISVISARYMTGPTLTEYANANNLTTNVPAYETSDIADAPVEPISASNDDSSINDSQSDKTSAMNATDSGSDIMTPEIDLHISNMVHFYDNSTLQPQDGTNQDRTIYSPGFYYEPIHSDVYDYITGKSLPTDAVGLKISQEDLNYLGIMYKDFNGLSQAGEIICNKAISQDLIEIFYKLYISDYRLEKVVLIDNFNGDDEASMSANNSSCFNYRVIAMTDTLSNHAYGVAIDINPFYNPYIVYGGNEDGSDRITPSGSEIYADRTRNFAYKIDENDLCYRLFLEHGFTWGGDWNSSKDYQHFEKTSVLNN